MSFHLVEWYWPGPITVKFIIKSVNEDDIEMTGASLLLLNTFSYYEGVACL